MASNMATKGSTLYSGGAVRTGASPLAASVEIVSFSPFRGARRTAP
jgi:hypothetical protein